MKNLSVIIPTFNRADILPQIMRPLLEDREHILEIIIADDGSTDRTVEIAGALGARVLPLQRNQNANLCRNQGARVATGDILLFLDSDVVLTPASLPYLQSCFENPAVDGVVGVYSAHHPHGNLVSQYKNLWIRYSFIKSQSRADWIFGAVSAIRREAFLKVHGFNEAYQPHNADDLDLGKRLVESSFSVMLDPNLSVEHLKRHTLKSLLRNDFVRSRWFVFLADFFRELSSSWKKGVFNVYPGFILATALAPVLSLLVCLSFLWKPLLWAVLITLVIYLFLNFPFLRYFKRERGWGAALLVIPVLYLDHWACALGASAGMVDWLMARLPGRPVRR